MTGEVNKSIRILVVEDSPTVLDMLVHILDADPGIQVVGTAGDGKCAVAAAVRLKPDAITMDVHMPEMNGLEATRRIMETVPVPIVIVSASGSYDPSGATESFRAIEAGAVAVARKPPGIGHPQHETAARELIQTVKLMSEVKLVRRTNNYKSHPSVSLINKTRQEINLVAIGASTGGPPVLRDLLSRLPRDFPAAVLIVQHMAEGFIESFVDWLSLTSSFSVHLAVDGTLLQPGHAYVAPEGHHLTLGIGNRIKLTRDEPVNGSRPSVSCLFRSISATCARNAVGVLLTGMGKDGAEELGMMKEEGAITIAQDSESSVIFGMPGEAVNRGAAQYVLPPVRISELLTRLVNSGVETR